MRYSLLSRFRGTFLGTIIGEALAQQPTNWSQLVIVGTESLIHLGKFDLDDWRYRLGNLSFPQEAMNWGATKALIALPVALFYHENEIKLRQNLISIVSLFQDKQFGGNGDILFLQDDALATGYAISQALTEKLNPASLIPQTIAFLGESQTPLVSQLTQVQRLLEERATLEKAMHYFSRDTQPSTPTALAFYCFLNTLEDFRLSVLQATRTAYQPRILAHNQGLVSALTGALSGTHNSAAGIPSHLHLKLPQENLGQSTGWQAKTEAEVLELPKYLLAVWAGVYDQAKRFADITEIPVTAAPKVMRLR